MGLVIFMQVLAQYCTVFDSVCHIGSCVLLRIYWQAARYFLREVKSMFSPPGSLREPFIGAGRVGGPSLGKLTLDIAARLPIEHRSTPVCRGLAWLHGM
ncbi:hypothetical protein HaLaN_28491, partial [Haematococcus lacustris]